MKLGEITNLSDARFAAGRGADFVGFNFTPNHPRYIAPEQAQEIIGWLDGPKLVGEWNEGIKDIICDTAERLKLDYIQLNWVDAALSFKLQEWNIIQNIDISQHIDEIIKQIDATQGFTNIFMLTLPQDADLEKFMADKTHLQMLESVCRDYSVMLNFPFTPGNLLKILDALKPFGINLNGDNEIKPGLKDFDLLNELIDLIEIE
ncbi:MAG: phosphoribosylanthranilate isomerase [Bacteroidia bacterium]